MGRQAVHSRVYGTAVGILLLVFPEFEHLSVLLTGAEFTIMHLI